MKYIFTVIIIFATIGILSAQYTVETVPNPNKNGWFVSNPDNIITKETVNYLNLIIKSAHDEGKVQTAVVVVNSIGERVPKEFANELFNYWGVGDASTNNGLLILLVLDQRTVSFETGYGIEESLTDVECYNIQQEFMIPYFKENDYDNGLIEGTKVAIEEANGGEPVANKLASEEEVEEDSFSALSGFLIIYVFILLINFIDFIITVIKVNNETDLPKSYKAIKYYTNIIFVVFFPFPFLFVMIYSYIKLKKIRNAPRISPSGKIMYKLDEKSEDMYLESGKKIEEEIGSADYDVWITEDGDEVLVQNYTTKSSYSVCPKCNYLTYYLNQYTTTDNGKRKIKYTCKHCGYSKINTYKIHRNTGSSGGGSYSSGGSSGGSSWGGGSSGGGGASSSW